MRRETPQSAGPLKIFKYFLIHANAGPPSGQANALFFYEKIKCFDKCRYLIKLTIY